MEEGQAPLVPAEVDLRDFGFMPLEFRRLFTSNTWLLAKDAEKIAALALWCESWHQVPAGSLPDNDRVLATLSQMGTRWIKHRNHALRGWLKCTDGRLYHPVVAAKALDAWGKKLEQRRRTRGARIAKLQKQIQHAEGAELNLLQSLLQGLLQEPDSPVTTPVTEAVTGSKGQLKGQLKGKEENNYIVGQLPGIPPPPHGEQVNGSRQVRMQALEILCFLNEKAKRNYQPGDANLEFIVARLREGATPADCRAVIAKKCREWLGDEKMNLYLRPATLFNRTKFAQYRGELKDSA